MLYEPFRDNIFILLDKKERVTAGGIMLPDTAQGSEYGPMFRAGTVIKAGSGGMGYDGGTGEFQFYEVDVTEGDRVVVHKSAGQDVVVGEHIKCEHAPDYPAGTEFRVIRNTEVAGVLEATPQAAE